MGLMNTSLSVFILGLLLAIGSSRPAITDNCHEKAADIAFVVDTSTSIWPPDFKYRVLSFISELVEMFDVGSQATQSRIAMVTFGDRYYHQFHLNDFYDKAALIQRIKNTAYRGGNTNTGQALKYVSTEIFANENGARDDVDHIIIILTDGKSDDVASTKAAALAAKKKGIQIIAIGVGPSVDYEELTNMASFPDSKFHAKNFKALDNIRDQLAIKTCRVNAKIPAETTISSSTSTTTSTTMSTPTTTKTSSTTSVETTSRTSANPVTKITTTTSLPKTSTTTVTTARNPASATPTAELVFNDQPMAMLNTQHCTIGPTDIMFVFESFSKKPVSRKIMRTVITDFAGKLKNVKQVRVGSVTDPCPEEENMNYLTLNSFKQMIGKLKNNIKGQLYRLIRKLRTVDFSSRSSVAKRQVAVLFLDQETKRYSNVVDEANQLKEHGVEVFVVAIGDVSKDVTVQSASGEDHILKFDNYPQFKSAKLDQLWNIC